MRKLKCLLPLTSLIVTIAVHASDWSQWRGQNRDGIALQVEVPKTLPKELNQEWKIEVGEGHSSPVIAGDRVFIHTRVGEDELVRCLNLKDGSLVWESQKYPVPYEMNMAALRHGKGPKSTPVLNAGRLFTQSITGILSGWDASSGKLLWRRDFESEFEEQTPLYGFAASPLVHEDLLIAQVGGHNSGGIAALDVESGKTVWMWKGDGPGYSSPVLTDAGGTLQVVAQSQQKIVSLSVDEGKLLWELPFETPHVQNSVTPLAYRDLVIFSGLENRTFAVRPQTTAEGWTAEEVWSARRYAMYMSSPVLSGDAIFGLAHRRKGQYFCLNAGTGEVLWTSDGLEGDYTSFVLADHVLLLLTRESQLQVVRNSTEGFEKLAEYEVADSPTWAHLVVQGQNLLVKDLNSLALFTW